MSLVTFRHFCSSPELLRFYRPDGDVWSCARGRPERFLDAVVLSLRHETPSLPDHQHRQRVARAFGTPRSLCDMLLRALGASDMPEPVHGLSARQGRICVDAPAFEDWQREVAAYQSPLPLLAAFRLREAQRLGLTGNEIAGRGACSSQVERQLKEDLCATCLPGMHDPRLDELVLQDGGTGDGRAMPGKMPDTVRGGRLTDVHMHINGSTEATVVWLHALTHPARFCGEVDKAAKASDKARFFLHQLHSSQQEIFKDLRRAAILRQTICRLLTHVQTAHTARTEEAAELSWAGIACRLKYVEGNSLLDRHPLWRRGWTDLQCEGLFWLRALVTLRQTGNSDLAALLHFYLLLMHQFFRLLVQHPDQYGFDQFQYITVSGGREAVENERPASFRQRFAQFCGMYGAELDLLEARFSPKSNIEQNCRLLRALWKGHAEAMRAEQDAGRAVYDISLVAHFIKQKEKKAVYRAALLHAERRRHAQSARPRRHAQTPACGRSGAGTAACGQGCCFQ